MIRSICRFSTSLLLLLSTAGFAQNEQQWGDWAKRHDSSKSKLQNSSDTSYGSGIAGLDENRLHQLDQSSLLDYAPQLEPRPETANTLPEFSIGNDTITVPEAMDVQE